MFNLCAAKAAIHPFIYKGDLMQHRSNESLIISTQRAARPNAIKQMELFSDIGIAPQ